MVKVGRPTKYTKELGADLCSELAQGKSLRKVCKSAKFPSVKTIFNWIRDYPEFLQQYEKAKEESSDFLVEEMLDIADQSDKKESPQRSRLRVDTRKWAASKLKPKKYGERLDLTSGGEKLPAPILNHASLSDNNSDTQDTSVKEKD